ncbi:MAG: transglutaminase domain-containing protein [Planctomycetota bacterium]|nr:transglutaminase domain-containing protein [Planctomycetota bacterium]
MSRISWGVLAACAAFAVVGPLARAADDYSKVPSQEAPAGAKSRTFTLTYTAKVEKVPEGAKKLELWLPVPQDNAHQKITGLKFSAEPTSVGVETVYGNKIAYWKLEGDAVKPVTVEMTFTCARQEIAAKDLDKAKALSAEELDGLKGFLKGYKLVPVGDDVKDVTAAAVGEKSAPPEVAKAAYEYVLANMKYSKEGTGWGTGSTKWACDSKYGNCTDFHALFMSIGMSKGLPVKFEMGIPLPEDKTEGPIGGYHCWAKFFLGGIGWVPVDISEAAKQKEKYGVYYFGNLTPDRVQFTTGREVDLAPKQAGGTLNFFIYPYAEADGAKIETGKAFSFKDVAQ